MSILITGGSGFIGSHIVDKFVSGGFNVIVLDKVLPNFKNEKATYYNMDLNADNLEEIFESNDIKYVIHMAAQASVSQSIKDPIGDMEDNIKASINLIKCCQKHKIQKFIAASTAALYANPEYLPIDEKHIVNALSPYAISKNAMEQYIKISGLDYLIFRYSNVYGPRQNTEGETGVIAVFVERMLNQQSVEIHGDGEQVRDFIYVEDIAEINLRAIKSNLKNEIMNFSSNTETTINELFEIMSNNTNYSLKPIYTPPRQGDIKKSVLDNKKAIELLGYEPKVALNEGLIKTVEFFNQKKLTFKK